MSGLATGLNSINALQDFDTELQDHVAASIDGLRERSDLAFARATEQLEAFRMAATQMVDGLEAETGKAIALITSAQSMLTERLASLDESAATLQGAIDEVLAQASADLDTASTALQQLADDAGNHSASVNELSDAFAGDIAAALDALAYAMTASQEQVANLAESLVGIAGDAQARAADFEQVLGQLADHLDELVEQARSALEFAVDNAQRDVGQTVHDTISDLESASGAAIEAVKALMDNADALSGSVGDEIGEVLDVIKTILDLIDKIKPVLELAEKLS